MDEKLNTQTAQQENQPESGSVDAADVGAAPDDTASTAAITDLLAQLAATGADITTLLGQELLLALGDSVRIAVLGRTLIHLAALAWLSFSILVSWIVFDVAGSGPLAALTFLLIQVAAGLLVLWMIRRYSASLTLPRTREHLGALMGRGRQ
ncbi:Uncharacterised protein [Halioglobus japonicus]|nr:Uncharacterised protein [Halioglobus japonicus]